MKLLLLGGIREAQTLAQRLVARGVTLTYSLAGVGRRPELPCTIHSGGFGGIEGLKGFLRQGGYQGLIDATHPFADQISQHAWEASNALQLPLWRYLRPAWCAQTEDRWLPVKSLEQAVAALTPYQRPLVTVGSSIKPFLTAIPPHQVWQVRALPGKLPAGPRHHCWEEIGPFNLADELRLMQRERIDVLLCKNSGGQAVAAKLQAARQLGIPVIMLERPALPHCRREYADLDSLIANLTSSA